MSSLSLRRIEDADLPRVDELFREAFELEAEPRPEFIANLRRTEPDGCFVAELEGDVVAYVMSHTSGSVGYVGNLAVAERCRGEGIGKAVTLAASDYLAERCSVVGLAVDATVGRNLGLYGKCGYVATLPSSQNFKPRTDVTVTRVPEGVVTAEQLGPDVERAIERIAGWTDRILPGLDFTRDLGIFVERYPDRLWIAQDGGEPRGFLAYHPTFRGDPWGAVEPGSGDLAVLGDLVDAMEASTAEDYLWMHVQTNFRRLTDWVARRGYRVSRHVIPMLLRSSEAAWPTSSDALLLRPWWT